MLRLLPGKAACVSNMRKYVCLLATLAAADYTGPVYLSFTRDPVPVLFDRSEYPFEIGKMVQLRDGRDATIIANRDLVVVRDVVLLLVAMVVFVNFVVDVLYAVVDPRLKSSDA